MKKEEEKIDFLKTIQNNQSTLGVFWDEQYKATILKGIELSYKTEIIREWGIQDIVINGDKVLIQWFKRFQPLTDEYLKDKYGR